MPKPSTPRGHPKETPEQASAPGDPPVRKIAKPSTPRCGASNRQGNPCGNAAGFKTDHPGEGRCHLHGGKSPVKHGRYARIKRPRIRELIEEYRADPDPLNVLPEVELLRALITDFVERYDENSEALIRWSRTFDREYQAAREVAALMERDPDDVDPLSIRPSKPDKVIDILSVATFIGQISSIVDRIRKARETQTFSMATIDKLWEAQSAHLMQASQEVIDDPALRESLLTAVAYRWGTINLAALASGRPAEGEGTD